jgi:hypothetical protein
MVADFLRRLSVVAALLVFSSFCAPTALEAETEALRICVSQSAAEEETSAGLVEELRAALDHGPASVVALLELWNAPNAASGLAGLAKQSPELGARLEMLDACIEARIPSLQELQGSGLPPLIIRLLERHVRTEVLLRFVYSHLPEIVPGLIADSFPSDQDFEYPEIVTLGLGYLSGSPGEVDAFVLGEVLPHIEPGDVLDATIFEVGYRRLSREAQEELVTVASPRVAFARSPSYRHLLAVSAERRAEAVRDQMRLADTDFQSSLREVLDSVGRGVDDPSGLVRRSPKLRQWLWGLWSRVRGERAHTQSILSDLRERSKVEGEQLRTLNEMRLHSAQNPLSHAFFAEAVAMLSGDGDDAVAFKYDLVKRWAPDDRYFMGFAARLSGPVGLRAEDLDVLPLIDVEKSSSLHALTLNAAAASLRSEAGLAEDLARGLGEYLLHLGEVEWAEMEAKHAELSRGLPVSYMSFRLGLRVRLYGPLVTTRFLDEEGAIRSQRMPEEQYAAFLTEYLGLDDGPPLG